jgi:hypothetical protein
MRIEKSSLIKNALVGLTLAVSSMLLAGCGMISGDTKIDEGIVITPKLKIRSTTAPAALDLAEVKRGDRLDILEQAQYKTPTQVKEWYKVRTKTPDAVEGWVETRYVINKSIADKVNDLYDKSKNTPSQGTGRLKVQTKLRMEADGQVVTYLTRNTMLEIVGKARTTIKSQKPTEADDADEDAEEPETRTVLWYQVRLPETEVLRAGWVGAQQVQLDVPDEILHLEGEGRRFTGWVVLDQTKDKKGGLHNNYIGLMKNLATEGPIDFTRLWVLSYSANDGRYFGAYIRDGLRGVLPITLGTSSGRKGFTIHVLGENDKPVPVEYEVSRDSSGRMGVRPLSSETPNKPAAGKRPKAR